MPSAGMAAVTLMERRWVCANRTVARSGENVAALSERAGGWRISEATAVSFGSFVGSFAGHWLERIGGRRS